MKKLNTLAELKKQKEFYKNFAEQFDQKCKRENSNHFYKIRRIEKYFLDLLFQNSGERCDIAELGAGTGIHTKHFLERFHKRINEFVCVDLSLEMIQIAKERLDSYPNIRYIESSAENLTLNEKIDGIYISGSLHHFENPYQVLEKIKKNILKKNGLLVVCEPIVWNPVNFIKALPRPEERNQFSLARRTNVRKYLKKIGYEILSDEVLHYCPTKGTFLNILWPREFLENIPIFDPLAIMYVFCCRNSV